jgi:hypothetical protein
MMVLHWQQIRLPLTGAWFGKGKHLVGSDGHLSNISLLFVLSGNHKSQVDDGKKMKIGKLGSERK